MNKISQEENKLYEAILQLKNIEECYKFFHDLCTPVELKSLIERWRVCYLLAEKKLSYREINKLTGISLTTIGRVARFLNQESYQGYKLILERMHLDAE